MSSARHLPQSLSPSLGFVLALAPWLIFLLLLQSVSEMHPVRVVYFVPLVLVASVTLEIVVVFRLSRTLRYETSARRKRIYSASVGVAALSLIGLLALAVGLVSQY